MRAAAVLIGVLAWPMVGDAQARAPRLAELLGMSRAAVDRALTVTRQDGQWVVYEHDVWVLYEVGVARRVRARLPDSNCRDAVASAGFDVSGGTFPRHDAPGVCTWSPNSVRHALAPHVLAQWRSGTLDLQWIP